MESLHLWSFHKPDKSGNYAGKVINKPDKSGNYSRKVVILSMEHRLQQVVAPFMELPEIL